MTNWYFGSYVYHKVLQCQQSSCIILNDSQGGSQQFDKQSKQLYGPQNTLNMEQFDNELNIEELSMLFVYLLTYCVHLHVLHLQQYFTRWFHLRR